MRSVTVQELQQDTVTQVASEYWLPSTAATHRPYSPSVIQLVYHNEVLNTHFNVKRIVVLEFSQYFESYLWPNYSEDASAEHMLSVVVLVNQKVRERVPAWTAFEKHPGPFKFFIQHLTECLLDNSRSLVEQKHMVMFINHLYNSIETDLVRTHVTNTISYHVLKCLSEQHLCAVFERFPSWKKSTKRTDKQLAKLTGSDKEKFEFEISFFYKLLLNFLHKVQAFNPDKPDKDLMHYCERFLEMMIDLESQLHTRRYINSLVNALNLIVKCEVAPLSSHPDGKLFLQLLYILKIFADFEINDCTGDHLTDFEVMKIHYDRWKTLKFEIFKSFPDDEDMREFSFLSVASAHDPTKLRERLNRMSFSDLKMLSNSLTLLSPIKDDLHEEKSFLIEILVSKFGQRPSQLEAINEMPLYPTEKIIWDDNIVPSQYYTGEACLALPKLNLQFLTLHDYLLRNFDLFRLESTYEIRQDIEDIVTRMRPFETEDGNTFFNGWARMAQPIVSFTICEVAKPNIGEEKPSRVRADITVNLNLKHEIKSEWEALRKHDVCLLLSIRYTKEMPDVNGYFPEEFGIQCVRGCEIEGMLDANGRVIEEGPEPKPEIKGDSRTFRVWLDCNQYKSDLDNKSGNSEEDVYGTFNVLMRRKPKENNFKAVLSTIRDLMNTKCVVPDWLEDIILGYGDPDSAHYSNRDNVKSILDFNDTFIDMEHLKESFPAHKITVEDKEIQPPFVLKFKEKPDEDKKNTGEKFEKEISVSSYVIPNRGPYPYTIPKKNSVRFTPTQVEAIRSGMQPGLTMVVGPPGTGKTDVAVQIISNIYHNNPNERTLIVTHSNQALNQLFEKIMCLDVDERHLLRLGHGEEALETEKDFSRYGRVNYVLNKRIELLDEVTKLKDSLGVHGDMGGSCETAGYFFLHHILSRWEQFISKVGDGEVPVAEVDDNFPFHIFFSNAPQPLFKGLSYDEDMEIAKGCFRYLENIFQQLKEFKAFEMLRSGLERTRYLLVKEAKIIAMTCTHAALKRHELVQFGFQFDNILMEESAQILEIETFIPLLLQNPSHGHNRLARWVMIGDHHQLPPVIKNMAFQKFSNMEQSLFTRFVRLGVPVVQLDAQGRARPELCRLYKWRYRALGDLPHVMRGQYQWDNPGFRYNFQLIDVGDLNGKGESEPRKYFYQNLAEAEYTVHLFMYMRLLGYPAHKISLLTTYNGQRELLRDVVEQRCATNPLFGRPHKIATVDKYQGQQNDYILLSLTRTRAVGHLRDVRRLIVAMSRARLGLYVFGRAALFANCYELQHSFELLCQRPTELQLAPWERYQQGPARALGAPLGQEAVTVEGVMEMSAAVAKLYEESCEAQVVAAAPEVAEDVGALPQRETQVDTGAKYDSDEEGAFEAIVNEVE